MSHLLYLDIVTSIPTSAHTSVFIELLNNFTYRSGMEKRPGHALTEEAHYTHRLPPCKVFERNISGFFSAPTKAVK